MIRDVAGAQVTGHFAGTDKWLAPPKFYKQVSKVTENIKKMSLGAWEQNLRLVPGCRCITLTEHWKMLHESFKYYSRGLPQATHASA